MHFSSSDAALALRRWQRQYRVNNEIAAQVLGVSRRTVLRWRASGRAPRWVAHCIDQITAGPWLKSATTRGPWGACRDNYVRVALYGADWASRRSGL